MEFSLGIFVTKKGFKILFFKIYSIILVL